MSDDVKVCASSQEKKNLYKITRGLCRPLLVKSIVKTTAQNLIFSNYE